MKRLCKIFSAAASLQEYPGAQTHIGKKDSQMLHGETFIVQKSNNGWSYGHSELDGYTGWVDDSHLLLINQRSRYAVICLMTNAYAAPDYKTTPAQSFSFMSRVDIDSTMTKDGLVLLRDSALWLPENHLMAVGALAANPVDIVDTALLFNDCPYVYGGRTAQGIDCSGLVQLAMQRNGLSCPRDASQQENIIGNAVTSPNLQGGDIVYFPGHVGIMKDDKTIINATMRHMKVIVENIDDLTDIYGPPTSVRRLGTHPAP